MGGSAPSADPRMGEAAVLSANTGRDMLTWMREQAKTTNGWAREDRNRYQDKFQPVEDRLIRDANTFDSAGRKKVAANRAVADVRQQSRIATDTNRRQMMALGVNPASRAFVGNARKQNLATSLASAGAANMARRQVDATAEGMRANVANMGRGMAVNPGTSMQISNGAMQAGGNAAMSGYGQQASILDTDYKNRMAAYQNSQSGLGSVLGALGSVAGFAFPSSKEIKTDKKPVDALGAVRKMPVEQWRYKDGHADGGTHIGPYAEDFAKATGVGDGKSIDAISAVGVTMGAIRQLADKVDALGARMDTGKRRMAA